MPEHSSCPAQDRLSANAAKASGNLTQNPSGPGDGAGRGEEEVTGGHRGCRRGRAFTFSFQARLLPAPLPCTAAPSFSAASLSVSQDPDPWFLVAANTGTDSLQGQGREVERKCLALSSGEGC